MSQDERTGARRRPGTPGIESALRTAAVWESVRGLAADRSSDLGRPLRIVDLGGGTGGLAVALAKLGHHLTVVDPSPDALASLARRADEDGVADRIIAVQGDAATLPELFAGTADGAQADLVCCHGVLEFVDDPAAALAAIASILAPGGSLSLVAAGRLAVVLARALAGQFAAAQHALTTADGRWGAGDLLPRRFDLRTLVDLVEGTGLEIIETRGVRIFSDLVPSAYVETEAERMALLDLERAAATHPDHDVLAQLGAALHLIAVRH